MWEIRDPKFEAEQLCPQMAVYPWSGHRRFAYDLVYFVRPTRVVELGAHKGTSFFAFCQAVKDAGLNTRCIAIDTWKGDEHTGPYDEGVYESVKNIVSRYFADIDVVLLRMLFSEALDSVEDESVDVLHIDGLHTYEAVSEDYHTWLPKLKPNGVVLFHDVAPSTGYGSARFWREIRDQNTSFEFPHSWGLGVLFPKGDKLYRAMARNNLEDKLRIYQFQAGLELSRIQVADVTEMAEQRYRAIQKQSRLIDERDALIRQQDELVRQRDDTIACQAKAIDERDEAIRRQAALIDDRDAALASQAKMIDERDAYLRELEELTRRGDESIRRLGSTMTTLEADLARPWFCMKAMLRVLLGALRTRG